MEKHYLYLLVVGQKWKNLIPLFVTVTVVRVSVRTTDYGVGPHSSSRFPLPDTSYPVG